jgi:hypothetical protein
MPVHRAEPRWGPLSSRPRSSRPRSSLLRSMSKFCTPSGAEVEAGIYACTPSGAEVMGCSQNLTQNHHARLHVYSTLLRRHILCRKHKKSQSENTSTHVR